MVLFLSQPTSHSLPIHQSFHCHPSPNFHSFTHSFTLYHPCILRLISQPFTNSLHVHLPFYPSILSPLVIHWLFSTFASISPLINQPFTIYSLHSHPSFNCLIHQPTTDTHTLHPLLHSHSHQPSKHPFKHLPSSHLDSVNHSPTHSHTHPSLHLLIHQPTHHPFTTSLHILASSHPSDKYSFTHYMFIHPSILIYQPANPQFTVSSFILSSYHQSANHSSIHIFIHPSNLSSISQSVTTHYTSSIPPPCHPWVNQSPTHILVHPSILSSTSQAFIHSLHFYLPFYPLIDQPTTDAQSYLHPSLHSLIHQPNTHLLSHIFIHLSILSSISQTPINSFTSSPIPLFSNPSASHSFPQYTFIHLSILSSTSQT